MDPWLIVGLGNPGPKYALHRHNIGTRVAAELAAAAGVKLSVHKSRALVAQIRLGVLPGGRPGPSVVVAAPQTFMNLSGGPVAAVSSFYSIPIERIIVLHDELDIDPYAVRLKRGGGEGGHNGLRSITSSLGGKDYVRVRLGVGRPPGHQDPADYVLSNFPAKESQDVGLLIGDGCDAVSDVINFGLEAAQQRFHSR